jgi:DUF4097 and DUF4098 domain-containing protein YvlB
MAGYPPPYPPPPPGPYGPPNGQDWKYQRRMLRDQAKAQRDQYRYQMRAMRRRSILGPVIVVLVGVVFLLTETGHLRNDRLWDWYGHWWPLLLVVVGIVLLAEWGIDQLRPQDPQRPYFRRSIGGGVIGLVIALSITGIILNGLRTGHNFNFYGGHGMSLNSDNLEEFLGDKHESDESIVEALPAGSALSIDNPRGDVIITGGSSDNQVHLSIHKQVYSRSDSDAENRARQLTPRVTRNGNLLLISFPSMSGAVADVTATVPPGVGATVTANHGDIHIDALKAPVTLTANHGDVELSGISGPVTAHVNNNGSSFSAHNVVGPVMLEGHADDLTLSDISGPVNLSGDFYGTTHLEHISSNIKFHTSRSDFQLARLDGEMEVSSENISADQAVGPVVLTTGNRNITLERISGDLAVTNRNGSVDLTSAPPLGNVTIQNRNGSVSLTLPDHANFAVNAETNDGDMENDFSLPAQETNNRKTLSGTVGKGGSLIRINTSQGDVSLKKASIAPLPPKPPAPPAPPQVSISDADGSSVYVGKDGVRIISGADGSSVIVGKDGLHITANADGSTVYRSKDGTQLIEGADGSKRYIGRNGMHYTVGVDGSKMYRGADGSSITINPDGSQRTRGTSGRDLNDSEVQDRLRRAQDEVHEAEQQRDKERRDRRAAKND